MGWSEANKQLSRLIHVKFISVITNGGGTFKHEKLCSISILFCILHCCLQCRFFLVLCGCMIYCSIVNISGCVIYIHFSSFMLSFSSLSLSLCVCVCVMLDGSSSSFGFLKLMPYFVSLSSGTHLFWSTTGEFNFEEYQEKIIHAPEFTHAI